MIDTKNLKNLADHDASRHVASNTPSEDENTIKEKPTHELFSATDWWESQTFEYRTRRVNAYMATNPSFTGWPEHVKKMHKEAARHCLAHNTPSCTICDLADRVRVTQDPAKLEKVLKAIEGTDNSVEWLYVRAPETHTTYKRGPVIHGTIWWLTFIIAAGALVIGFSLGVLIK